MSHKNVVLCNYFVFKICLVRFHTKLILLDLLPTSAGNKPAITIFINLYLCVLRQIQDVRFERAPLLHYTPHPCRFCSYDSPSTSYLKQFCFTIWSNYSFSFLHTYIVLIIFHVSFPTLCHFLPRLSIVYSVFSTSRSVYFLTFGWPMPPTWFHNYQFVKYIHCLVVSIEFS